MTNVVVTGAGGFIGSAVARAFESAGHHVHAAATSSDRDPLTRARIAALPDFDLVVHCAGGSSVGASVEDPEREHAKSVPPLEALLEHVARSRPQASVILLSSAAVYGNAASVPTPETAPLAPLSPYGLHKRICEELCASSGVRTLILRLFSIYGPGLRKQLLWDACRKARAGDVTFAGTGDEQRDWLHVDDAAALVVAASPHASREAPIINGASGVGVRVRDVVGQICQELGAPAPRFSRSHRAGDPDRYVADIARARTLGWIPRIGIREGVSEYVTWFKQSA